jgi:hypothetical protein
LIPEIFFDIGIQGVRLGVSCFFLVKLL